jgi:1-phosphofructokinase
MMTAPSSARPEPRTEGSPGRGHVVVLAPRPLITVTVESSAGGDEIHFHPGGQGVWVARLIANLGVDVVLCATFGGESGVVVKALLEPWGITVRVVETAGWNGGYIHDRRSGSRRPIAEMQGARSSRHEVDELYGATLVAGLQADIVVLGGPELPRMSRSPAELQFPLDVYSRLAQDLRGNGVRVMADLSGEALDAALAGGIDVIKISDEELLVHGHIDTRSPAAVIEAIRRLRERGADAIVVTRANQPTLTFTDGKLYAVVGPTVQPVDPRGAGDAVMAGMVASLAQGHAMLDAVKLGTAAGTLNVTRRGFGSGSPQEIRRLAKHVSITELERV